MKFKNPSSDNHENPFALSLKANYRTIHAWMKKSKGPSTLATLFNHMWPRIVAGIFILVGNHYFQALASTLQFVAQVCDRLWLVPATDRAFAYITYMSPPHVALVCSGPPQCAATCGWTKWPVCSGPKGSKLTHKVSGLKFFQVHNRTKIRFFSEKIGKYFLGKKGNGLFFNLNQVSLNSDENWPRYKSL